MAHALKSLLLYTVLSDWNQGNIKLAVGPVHRGEACHQDCSEVTDGQPLPGRLVCMVTVLIY